MVEIPPTIIKLVLAVVLGAVIGIEREYRDKAAGFRTVILICLGSTLFTIVSMELSSRSDPARIAAQIVTGVGFLGAGAILREGGRIIGLTTAAIIWLAAATGMLIGAGFYTLAVAATLVVAVVLWFFPYIERIFDRMREVRTYEVECDRREECLHSVENIFLNSGLKIINCKKTTNEGQVTIQWTMVGKPGRQRQLSDQLLNTPAVKYFTYHE